VVPPPAATSAAPASFGSLPATFDRDAIAALGLDPDYVRLVYVVKNDDGSIAFEHPQDRWEGGPLVLCGDADPEVPGAGVEEVHTVTGLPVSIAEAGCNVRWVRQAGGHTAADRVLVDHSIVSARISRAAATG
jgi:hypothetical protein